MLIKNVTIVTHEKILYNHWIHIQDNTIQSIGKTGDEPEDADVYDAKNQYALPGAIDIHIHGSHGVDAMDGNAAFFNEMAAQLPNMGTTSYLMTTMTESLDIIRHALASVKDYRYESGAEMLGIHVEGPFINKKHRGAQNAEYIIKPDVTLMKEFMALTEDKIKIVTFAPEQDKELALAKYLHQNNIIPSVGHSDATYDTLKELEQLGDTHLTHYFNGMRGIHHREPGVAGFGLMGRPFVELICDGIHVSKDMVKFAYNFIGPERLMLITDAMPAQGLEDGTYPFGGQEVVLKNGEARLKSGSLAGSVVSIKESIKNMKEFTNCTWMDIVKMTSYNQSKRLNLNDRGEIAVGMLADIVIYNSEAELQETFIRGKSMKKNNEN